MRELEKQATPNEEELPLLRMPVAGYLRLHHFVDFIADGQRYKDSSLYLAIEGMAEGAELATVVWQEARGWHLDRKISLAQKNNGEMNSYDYIYDVIGNWGLSRIINWQQQTVREIERLAAMPDSAVIKLGVEKDIICKGCAVGEHCSLSSMARYNPPSENDDIGLSTIAGEEKALGKLLEQLSQPDYQLEYGVDYMAGEELVELTDDAGKTESVSAPYMLVTMGAVRNLVLSTSKSFVA